MRILLVSDVHLDSPFAWAKPDVARRRRQGLRDALTRSIQLATDQHVDIICCGGDLFEHDRVSPDTGQFLRVLFERVYPIPTYVAPGNHDWLGPESLYQRVNWSPNVHIFESRRLTPVAITDGLTLWGGAHLAPAGAPDFLDGFRVERGGVHVALFHGSALGTFFAEEQDKQPHAPFRPEEIERAGLYFALLGHYHAPRDEKTFSYPGNPEPLTFGESGARGAVITTINGSGNVMIERHSVAITKVCDVEMDLTGCASKQELRDRVAAALLGRSGYVRLTLGGELSPDVDLHPHDFDDLSNGLDSPPLVRFGSLTVAYDLDRIGQEPTVRGQFVRDVQASALPADERQRVIITGLRALDGRTDLEVF